MRFEDLLKIAFIMRQTHHEKNFSCLSWLVGPREWKLLCEAASDPMWRDQVSVYYGKPSRFIGIQIRFKGTNGLNLEIAAPDIERLVREG